MESSGDSPPPPTSYQGQAPTPAPPPPDDSDSVDRSAWYWTDEPDPDGGPADEDAETEYDEDPNDPDYRDPMDETEDDGGNGDDDDDDDDDDDEDDDDEGQDDDEDGDEYHDAETGEAFELFIQGDGTINIEGPAAAGLMGTQRLMGLIQTLLQGRDLRGPLLFRDDDDDDEDDDDFGRGLDPRRPRHRHPLYNPDDYEKVPSEAGRQLMESGVFGTSSFGVDANKDVARRILDRELGEGDRAARARNQGLMAQSMLPATAAEMIVHYDEPVYSGQFSDDGNYFFASGHDFKVRMYDTSNPYAWQHYKTVEYPFGQWTLTDASLSPDNRWLAYTSIQSNVCLAPTDPNDTGDPYTLDLADADNDGGRNGGGWRSRRSFGIWSVRFSGDGRELVAGTNANSIVVYDIESRRVLHSVRGHDDDVNAVCFADRASPHVLYSGSDDATIKVWDRRSMGDGRPAGAFVGHVEGLTYIDSKGDGRYILSNAKDQTMKLWDLRAAMSTDAFRDRNPQQWTRGSDFDYRWHDYENWFKHPDDNSLVTFRGHKVLRTLIRCHFSPPGSTNSRYVYSGSQDGKVYIWNLDATLAGTVDVFKATVGSRPPNTRYNVYRAPAFARAHEQRGWGTCVRDVSWHPHAPVLVASSWNGINMSNGTCTVHSFNMNDEDEGEPKMGLNVDERLRTGPPVPS